MSDGFLLYPPAGGSGSLADGDYGDIVVSGGGAAMDIDADAVGTTEIADDSVTDGKLRDSAGLSVIGNPTSLTADPQDIPSGGADQVLITNGAGNAIGFGQVATGGITNLAVTTAKIANDNVTFAKIENILTDSLIGRDTAGTGDPENISLNATLSMTGGGALQRAALTGDVTAAAGSNATTIANNAVTNSKMASAGVTSVTVHTEYFTDRKAQDFDAAGAMALGMNDAIIPVNNDAEQHAIGIFMSDAGVTWARFGFAVPQGVTGDLTVKMCFLLNSAPAGGDQIDIDVVGAFYEDNQSGSSTTNNFSVATVLVIDTYGGGDYAIVELNGGGTIGVSLAPGNYVQGVIQRDARVANADDTYADLIVLQWVQFNGFRTVLA